MRGSGGKAMDGVLWSLMGGGMLMAFGFSKNVDILDQYAQEQQVAQAALFAAQQAQEAEAALAAVPNEVKRVREVLNLHDRNSRLDSHFATVHCHPVSAHLERTDPGYCKRLRGSMEPTVSGRYFYSD